VENLGRAIPAAINSLILLIVVMLAFAVMGMQLFGDVTVWDAAVNAGIMSSMPRLNFSTMWLALVTVFQVVDNENWNDTLVSLDHGASAHA
jgi:hypothetical protein